MEWEVKFDAWLRYLVAQWDGRVDHGRGIANLMFDELEIGFNALIEAGEGFRREDNEVEE